MWQRLIGVPYERLACAPLAREVYALAGRPLPPDALSIGSDLWDRVGDDFSAATQELDIIASDPEGKGVASHVSVVVKEPEHGHLMAMTTGEGHGACLVRRSAVQRVVGVYRLRSGQLRGLAE